MTPAEISANSNCFACIPNPLLALLYVFDQVRINGGGSAMTPAQIAEQSACYACIPNPQAALLMLANTIVVNGGGGGGGTTTSIVALTGSDSPTPAQGPASGGGIAYNEVPNLWTWNTSTSQWDLIV